MGEDRSEGASIGMLLVERQPIYMEIDARHIFNADFPIPAWPLEGPEGKNRCPLGMSIKMSASIAAPERHETEDYFTPFQRFLRGLPFIFFFFVFF